MLKNFGRDDYHDSQAASQLREYRHMIDQKLIVATLFARRKESNVPEDDLFVLYWMEKGEKIQCGEFLCNLHAQIDKQDQQKHYDWVLCHQNSLVYFHNFLSNGLTHDCFTEIIELYNLGKSRVGKRDGKDWLLEHVYQAKEEMKKEAEKRNTAQENKTTPSFKKEENHSQNSYSQEGEESGWKIWVFGKV